MDASYIRETKMSGAPPVGNPPPYSEAQAPPPVMVTQPRTTVIHTTTMGTAVVPVVVGQQMGPRPTTMVCKSCNYQIVTRVELKSTMRTHLFAALLCVLGCWPCVFIPYCTDSCNNADHYCPNCSAYIGTYVN